MTQLWFVDVRYSWPGIAHTDRYVTCAANAKEAKAAVAEVSDTAHTGWRTAKSPPRISVKAYAIGLVSLVGYADRPPQGPDIVLWPRHKH